MTIDDVTLDFPQTVRAFTIQRWKEKNGFPEQLSAEQQVVLDAYLATSAYNDDEGAVIIEMYANRASKLQKG